MSRLTERMKSELHIPDDQKCSFCGEEEATAVWSTYDAYIFCCYECGRSVLPRFIADACQPHNSGQLYPLLDKVAEETAIGIALNALKR